jgi:hypothetical protein
VTNVCDVVPSAYTLAVFVALLYESFGGKPELEARVQRVCVDVCMHVCMYLCVNVCTKTHIHAHACLHACCAYKQTCFD